jgi:hypothetical protein
MKPIGGDPTLCQTSSFLRFEFPLFGETNFKTIAGFDVSFNNASFFSFPDSRIPGFPNSRKEEWHVEAIDLWTKRTTLSLAPFPFPPSPNSPSPLPPKK